MKSTTAATIARCEDCSKTYRVPSADRAYACRACGGIVRTLATKGPAPEHAPGPLVLCNECQTLHPLGTPSCSECEAELAHATVVENEEQAADLLEATKQTFRRASRWNRGIAWTYQVGAVAYAIATLFAVLALAHPQVPLGGGVLVVALLVAMSVLMGSAALHLLFQPYLWTLAVALLATGIAVVHAMGPNPFGLALLGSAAWAALSWALLVPAHRLQTGIEHHRDLYIENFASLRTKQSMKGRSPGERHARLLAAMRRADRKAWKISAFAGGALVLASTVGVLFALETARPQTFEAALAAFEDTWNGGSADGIEPLFDARVRAVEATRLRAVSAGYGWRAALPTLPEGALRAGDSELERDVEYDLSGIDLIARFALRDLEWRLVDLQLPCPPIEPALERFRSAWEAGDVQGLADLHSPERRAEVREQLEESRSRRGWDVFPPILGTQLRDMSDRNATAVLDLGGGRDVTVTWYFRDDGVWGVFGLQMPKSTRR